MALERWKDVWALEALHEEDLPAQPSPGARLESRARCCWLRGSREQGKGGLAVPPISKHSYVRWVLCHARRWTPRPTQPRGLGHPVPILLPHLRALAAAPHPASMVLPAVPGAGSIGSAAHTGLFIVRSRGAGGSWQRRSLHRGWRQDGHLHGNPVHISGWVGCIYLFAGLFSLVVTKQPVPGTVPCISGVQLGMAPLERPGLERGCRWLGRAGGASVGCQRGMAHAMGTGWHLDPCG